MYIQRIFSQIPPIPNPISTTTSSLSNSLHLQTRVGKKRLSCVTPLFAVHHSSSLLIFFRSRSRGFSEGDLSSMCTLPRFPPRPSDQEVEGAPPRVGISCVLSKLSSPLLPSISPLLSAYSRRHRSRKTYANTAEAIGKEREFSARLGENSLNAPSLRYTYSLVLSDLNRFRRRG